MTQSAKDGRQVPKWGAAWRSPADSAKLSGSVDYCWRFFMGKAEAQQAAEKLVAILECEGIAYAIIGALALNEYGHRRVTVRVDLVMREEDLQAFKRHWLGRGYGERVPGTGKLIDTELGVHIDVLSTGRFPGDDKPKPIAFPDPATTAIRGAPFALLPVEKWIELKLASGMVAAHASRISPTFRSSSEPQVFRERWRTISIPGCAVSSSSCGTPWTREPGTIPTEPTLRRRGSLVPDSDPLVAPDAVAEADP